MPVTHHPRPNGVVQFSGDCTDFVAAQQARRRRSAQRDVFHVTPGYGATPSGPAASTVSVQRSNPPRTSTRRERVRSASPHVGKSLDLDDVERSTQRPRAADTRSSRLTVRISQIATASPLPPPAPVTTSPTTSSRRVRLVTTSWVPAGPDPSSWASPQPGPSGAEPALDRLRLDSRRRRCRRRLGLSRPDS